jgi:hypothetical protein
MPIEIKANIYEYIKEKVDKALIPYHGEHYYGERYDSKTGMVTIKIEREVWAKR